MDSVRERYGEELQDVELCPTHNRLFYCYCTQCYCLICPSCLMFDTHKGHQVCRIEEGAKSLRVQISDASKDGVLKFERTENVLLDIRHAKLTLEENRDKLLKQAENNFDEIISTLKTRKAKFLEEFAEHFDKQLDLIVEAEYRWYQRQQVSQEILQIQKSNEELRLIQNGRMIVNSLEEFRKPLGYISVKLLKGLNCNLDLQGRIINHEELLKGLEGYMSISDQVINQFKA